MFAPPVVKPKAKITASLNAKSALLRATPFGYSRAGSAEHLLTLQRSIGNRAVLQLLRQQGLLKNEHGGPEQDVGQKSVSARGGPPLVQTKLEVGAVDDPLEHEADRVAEQVMRMSDLHVSARDAPPQVSGKCATCEDEEKLQKKPTGPQAAVGEAPALVHEVLHSPGRPLDAVTRAYFEPRFGQDFSGVRIHTDEKAAASARAVNAHAYTVSDNMVFDTGRFAPGTQEGQRLIAHELAHVVQQAGSTSAEKPRQAAFTEQSPSGPRLQGKWKP